MGSDDGGEAAAPGWYPDPKRLPRDRYFDGHEWTSSVRDRDGLASDPMGPLPAGRDAWIDPLVMAALQRPSTPTWWTRNRRRVGIGSIVAALMALGVAAIVQPSALGSVALYAVAAAMLALRIWSSTWARGGDH